MKVALCVPCYDGRVHDAHMASVINTMALAARQGLEIQLFVGRGIPVLPDVRNWSVAMALASGCDKVWFVDSDIAWETCVLEVLNMLMAPVDIVAGVHQKRNTNWNSKAELVVQWGTLPPPIDEATGLWEVDRVATAFVAIDRSVFERLAAAGIARNYLPAGSLLSGNHYPYYRNYFWYDFIPVAPSAETQAHLAEIGYSGPLELLRGEDFYFCAKAKEIGAKIYVDPRIELVHFDGCVRHDVSLKDVEFEAVS